MSQCESSDSISVPVSKCKYLDMPTAKHREKVMSVYFLSWNKAGNSVLLWLWGVFFCSFVSVVFLKVISVPVLNTVQNFQVF